MNESQPAILVSVIMVCHNDGKWLPRCLESIRNQTIADKTELIIEDNVSDDGTDRVAQSLIEGWKNARFFSTGGDNGFGVACNRGAEVARGKYLYLLNPDTWLEPDCIEKLYQAAEQREAAVAGAVVFDYDDVTVQVAGGTGFDFTGTFLAVTDLSAVPELLICPGAFFFIRRDLFLNVGMMDDKFFLYAEEMDLSWRIWISGHTIVSVVPARIHHQGAVGVNPAGGDAAGSNRTSVQKRFLANRNRLLFLAKDCQHILLLMLFPAVLMILLEGIITWIMTRSWTTARKTSLDAIAGAWKLRRHVFEQRRRIAAFRKRGDFWMLRFFRLGIGRWGEVKKILKRGFPKF